MQRKNHIIIILLIALAAIAAIQLASAEITVTVEESPPPVAEADQPLDTTASDLAVIAGLPEQSMLDLYTALGNWEQITENIFVYKQILALAPQEADDYANLLALIQQYEADVLLAVLQFLADKHFDFDRAEAILTQAEQGQDLEEVLTATLAEKAYQTYIPADQDQIRQWLAAGYLPQDIINADTIAMAQDLNIIDVLELKFGDRTWEEIGQLLGYDFGQEDSVTITVEIAAGAEILTAASYQDLVAQANQQAELRLAALEQDLLSQFALTENKLAEYQQQGLNLNEIKNLLRLEQETGSPAAAILNDKLGGLEWKDVVKKHTAQQWRKPNE